MQSGAPSSAVELRHRIATAWASVLPTSDVRITDNFVGLGGDSLLATIVAAQLSAELGIEVSLVEILDAKSLDLLTKKLSERLLNDHIQAEQPSKYPNPLPLQPLSPTQLSLWNNVKLCSQPVLFNIPLAFRIVGPLDVRALSTSVQRLAAEHPALRTGVVESEDGPRFFVRQQSLLRLSRRSAGGSTYVDRVKSAFKIANTLIRRPFSLADDMLVRASLIRVSRDEQWLVMVFHHLIADGFSLDVVSGALSELFAQETGQRIAERRMISRARPRSSIELGKRAEDLAYWREKLAAAGNTVLDLPSDHAPPSVRRYRAGRAAIHIPVGTASTLREITRTTGSTLYMMLLAAYIIYLHRITQENLICVAMPIAQRDNPQTAGVIGCLMNTLVIRTEVDGEISFLELLKDVRRSVLDGMSHSSTALGELVREVNPNRLSSHQTLYQTMFLMADEPVPPPLGSAVVEPLALDTGLISVDISLNLIDHGGSLSGWLRYDRDLYQARRMHQMARQFEQLVQSIALDPSRHISLLELIPPVQRSMLLHDYNVTASLPPRADNLYSLVNARVIAQPDAIAVISGDQSLTYSQLDASADALCSRLRSAGVQSGSMVLVEAARGLSLPVAWLAVLKAGGAFIPIDPRWPPGRVHRVVGNRNVRVIVAEGDVEVVQPAVTNDTETMLPSEVTSPIDKRLVTDTENVPAYAFFTSGSTGEPKAALTSHSGLINRLDWMTENFPGTAPTVIMSTPAWFDSAVWQLFWPLIEGGTCIIPDDSLAGDPRYLAELVSRHKVSVIDFVPSVLTMMLPELAATPMRYKLRSLRYIIVGAEEIQAATVRSLLRILPWVRITNLYGTTETAIGSIAHNVRGMPLTRVPIGRPIANTKVVLLDRYEQLAAPGARGEILLGGACVGLGYINDQEETSRRFIRNPFPELHCGMLYKTGDVGRWHADGTLEFLGRESQQTKIRGIRVSLAEIENALLEHPAIAQASVKGVRDGPYNHLEANLTLRRPLKVTARDIKRFLRLRLPEYLIPQVIRDVDGMLESDSPWNFSLGYERTPGDGNRTNLEESISQAWRTVLGLRQVSLQDNFFDVGGDSLKILRLRTAIEAATGHEIALPVLFDRPTVMALTEYISEIYGPGVIKTQLPVGYEDELLSTQVGRHRDHRDGRKVSGGAYGRQILGEPQSRYREYRADVSIGTA